MKKQMLAYCTILGLCSMAVGGCVGGTTTPENATQDNAAANNDQTNAAAQKNNSFKTRPYIVTIVVESGDTEVPIEIMHESLDDNVNINYAIDINADGFVDVSDAVMLARFLAEDKTVKLADGAINRVDTNGDGKNNGDDVITILRHIAHLD